MRCDKCLSMQCYDSTCTECKKITEFTDLMSGDLAVMPKIDMGVAVTPDEKGALWSEEDEKRMDIIGSNGNDGAAYKS